MLALPLLCRLHSSDCAPCIACVLMQMGTLKKSMFDWNRKSEELHAIRNDLDEQRLLVMEVWKAVTGKEKGMLAGVHAPSAASIIGAPASVVRSIGEGLRA